MELINSYFNQIHIGTIRIISINERMEESHTELSPKYIVNNKYELKSLIKSGNFGVIYKGTKIRNGEEIAIKVDKPNILSLKHETRILHYLYSANIKHIPPVYWFGKIQESFCLVLPFYQVNLYEYTTKKNVTQKHLNIIIWKLLEVFESIHKKYVVHRDIKPQNLMVQNGEIILIDFGLATFFVNEDCTQHLPNEGTNTMIGTPKYTSVNIHQGSQYSRRDDLISLGYLYLYLLKHNCVWEPPHCDDDESRQYDIVDIMHPHNQKRMNNKMLTTLIQLCNMNHKDGIFQYLGICYDLKYEQKPNYELLKNLFYLQL